MEMKLSGIPPYSYTSVVNSHGWAQLAPFKKQEEGESLIYLMHLSTGKVVELVFTDLPGGVLVSTNNNADDAEIGEIQKQVRWMFALEQDLSDMYGMAKYEPKLQHLVENVQGRILRSGTFFEDVVKTILTTNTLWAATIRMCRTLVEKYGEAPLDNNLLRAFPTPERLAQAGETALREEAKLGYRAAYIAELAKRVAEKEIDLEKFKETNQPTSEVRKELLAIKGVGNYAAAVLLNILGRYDYLPVDTWALKMVSHEWYDGKPISASEVENAFAKWGEWKGLAYWFWNWKG